MRRPGRTPVNGHEAHITFHQRCAAHERRLAAYGSDSGSGALA